MYNFTEALAPAYPGYCICCTPPVRFHFAKWLSCPTSGIPFPQSTPPPAEWDTPCRPVTVTSVLSSQILSSTAPKFAMSSKCRPITKDWHFDTFSRNEQRHIHPQTVSRVLYEPCHGPIAMSIFTDSDTRNREMTNSSANSFYFGITVT